ncbi:MAG: hypothetical protein GY853_12250 [PVC group bacterium]|nr:hypothetical protein [PVC group bacterium]
MVKKHIDLSKITEEELLDLRVRDLPLSITGTWLQECVTHIYSELEAKGILFKPECYLADEWLTPDGEPVVGVPFFLAHPALMKLEKKFMLDVEGGTKHWCMKLLRHETGHAINYAYKLHKKKKWRKIFGPFSQEYADTYKYRPYSKSFVRHLEDYYAQYHPDEDFAETFAVWLTPHHNWRAKYKGWKALAKLQYVEELMQKIKQEEPMHKKGKKCWQAACLKITLKNYYKKKRRFCAEDFPDFHDINLKRIFNEKNDENKKCLPASKLIAAHRKNIISSVYVWTGEKKYMINDVLKTLMTRCKELDLVMVDPEAVAILRFSTYVSTLIMNYMYTGKLRGDK